MRSIHTEQDIRDACAQVIAEEGPSALSRANVQEALRRRAEAAGLPTTGADNALVGRVIRAILDERRTAKAAATETDANEAMAGDLPARLEEMLKQFGGVLRAVIGSLVTEVQRRAEADAHIRVQAAEQAAATRIAELSGEVESRREEAEALAGDHERALAELGERSQQVTTLEQALAACEARVTGAQAATEERIGRMERDLRAVEEGRRAAEAHAHEVAMSASRLEATIARLEERLVATERSRDEWREAAQRHEAQSRDVERIAEERRVRLELLTPTLSTARRRAVATGTPPAAAAAGAPLTSPDQRRRRDGSAAPTT